MNQIHVCLGSCQAQISDEDYKNGLTSCGNDACENKGKQFVKGNKCQQCGKTYAESQVHQH